MSSENVQAQTGNRVYVEFDGVRSGVIQSVRLNTDFAPEAVSGIGDIHAQEHAPTMARHVLNVTELVLKKSSLRRKGIMLVNGDDALKGLVFDIVVVDKDTKEVLTKCMKCSFASGDTEVQKHQIISHSAMFNCCDITGAGL